MQRQSQTKVLKNIPLIDKIGYGAGNLTFGVVIQIISTYMVFYSTVILNLPGSIIGLAIGRASTLRRSQGRNQHAHC
jgi:Na+/melibiose symporter-like transporter